MVILSYQFLQQIWLSGALFLPQGCKGQTFGYIHLDLPAEIWIIWNQSWVLWNGTRTMHFKISIFFPETHTAFATDRKRMRCVDVCCFFSKVLFERKNIQPTVQRANAGVLYAGRPGCKFILAAIFLLSAAWATEMQSLIWLPAPKKEHAGQHWEAQQCIIS